jgi:hypothetical protein
MLIDRNSIVGRTLSGLFKQCEDIAFLATVHGCVLEANESGWAFVSRWRKECGRKVLSSWLQNFASMPRCFQADHFREKNLELAGGRRFILIASRMPICDPLNMEPFFGVHAQELVGRNKLPLSELKKRYKLNCFESEIAPLWMNGLSVGEIAQNVDANPMEVKASIKAISRKIRPSCLGIAQPDRCIA